ncbi:Uncharacterised protein [Mycobacterium tuberculosis]|nr:Uncharacterised protein [Mycobacterium tuberculosis]
MLIDRVMEVSDVQSHLIFVIRRQLLSFHQVLNLIIHMLFISLFLLLGRPLREMQQVSDLGMSP